MLSGIRIFFKKISELLLILIAKNEQFHHTPYDLWDSILDTLGSLYLLEPTMNYFIYKWDLT